MTLDDARENINRIVIYFPEFEGAKRDAGIITSVNDTYVFVQYGEDKHSKATKPEDIDLIDSLNTKDFI